MRCLISSWAIKAPLQFFFTLSLIHGFFFSFSFPVREASKTVSLNQPGHME